MNKIILTVLIVITFFFNTWANSKTCHSLFAEGSEVKSMSNKIKPIFYQHKGSQVEIRMAVLKDAKQILELHNKYHIDTVNPSKKSDGFVGLDLAQKQIVKLIKEEAGVVVAVKDGRVSGYVMAGSWKFWSAWPIYRKIAKNLPSLKYQGKILTVNNSYQYGPICIGEKLRGSGTFEKIFDFSRRTMSHKYSTMFLFINKFNQRSLNAHVGKVKTEIIGEFSFSGKDYYQLVYRTSEPVDH